MITDEQLKTLKESPASEEIIKTVFSYSEYYLEPIRFINGKLNHKLNCSAETYRHAVEMANDEDVTPVRSIEIIVDGILALLYLDEEAINFYFANRFNPEFKKLVNIL